MLAGLRTVAKSKFIFVIIIIPLAISFAIWGVSDAFTARTSDAVAMVGPEKVTTSEYATAFRNQLTSMTQEAGESITTQEAIAAGIDRQILDQMITIAALDAKAKAMNLGGSDAAVARDIRGTSAFNDNVRGEFSQDIYRQRIAEVGYTPAQYEEEVRDDVARIQVIETVTAPAHIPAQMTQARLAYLNETRTAEVLILPAALVDLDQEPDDAALQAVMDENAAYFTFPEQRALSVAWLDMQTMQAIVQISDEDVQALYDFRREELGTPATRGFAQISAPDEAAANAAAERLRAGESPEAVAAALGLGAPILNASAAQRDIVDSALAEMIFESTEPRVFVAEGSLGWAAVQVTGGADAQEPTFAGVEAQLRTELAEDGASDTLYDAVARLEDARGAGQPLEEAAAAAGVALHSYPPVNAQGRFATGEFYADDLNLDLAQAPDLMARAFSMASGETSEVLELPDGGYAMLRVDEIVPERIATLDEMRDEAEALWRAQLLDTGLQEIADEARAMIEGGASFAEAAASIGQPARTELAIVRRGQTAGPVNAQLSTQLFAAAEGAIVSGRTESDSLALARVTAIETPPATDFSPVATLGEELNNDILTQFQNALSAEYPVRTYQDQIDLALGVGDQQ